jgi:hypothetical protein
LDDHIKEEMGWACGMCVGDEKYIQEFFGKLEGKRPLGRSRY